MVWLYLAHTRIPSSSLARARVSPSVGWQRRECSTAALHVSLLRASPLQRALPVSLLRALRMQRCARRRARRRDTAGFRLRVLLRTDERERERERDTAGFRRIEAFRRVQTSG
jgi:hypothetical protein